MAKTIATVKFVASIVKLFNLGAKIVLRATGFAALFPDVPPAFRVLADRLPRFIATIKRIQMRTTGIRQLIESVEAEVRLLLDFLEEINPANDVLR